jgi:ferredoxin
MAGAIRKPLLCSCAGTMQVDGKAIGEALGLGELPVYRQLCRADVSAYEAALADGEPLVVGCTQEAPLFGEIAEEAGIEELPGFTNIRERAGWCDGGPATAKMAALIAETAHEDRPARLKTIESDGLCLVYGTGQAAFDAARSLGSRLSVTLVLSDAEDVVLPPVMDVAVYRGKLAQASGSLGAFEVVIDDYAPMLPSSRAEPSFLMPRDGAKSNCSVIVDLSGGTPPFAGWQKRSGYLRADPRDPAAVARVLFEASDLSGTFEKPIYVSYDPDICAHSRSTIIGCSNCLDHCPAGAISSAGDIVVFDDGICGGCGSCASHCPTGAVSYDYPRRADLIARLQILIGTYRKAGGKRPVLLFHDESHGSEVVNLMARLGRGLPPHVLPLGLHSVDIPGHEAFASALAAGAERIVLLADPLKADEHAALEKEAALTNAILAGLGGDGAAGERVQLVVERDPSVVEDLLWELKSAPPIASASFEPVGSKREVARTALNLLRKAFPEAPEVIELPAQSPYGAIAIDTEGCTLCLACVSACPADALLDSPDRPEVRLVEAACVQCGLCARTCPEKVITLQPRLNFADSAMQPALLNYEEPFECISCGKPFASQSTIRRITERLAGSHWMFQSDEQARLIQMCDDCRITAQAHMENSPFAVGERPRIRTTEDYLSGELSADDFLVKD